MIIDRRLINIDRDGEWTVVDQDGIDPFFDPVVVLGDPGMGKTTLLHALCRRAGMDEWLAGAKAVTETGFAHDTRALRERPLTGAMPYG